MRRYFLEGFLAAAGAAACATLAVHAGSTVWIVIAMLLGGVAVACLAASLHPRSAAHTPAPRPRHRGPRRLGARRPFASSPATAVSPTPSRDAG